MKPVAYFLLSVFALGTVSAQTVDPSLIVPQQKSEMVDLIPTLLVADMRRAEAFYNDRLGFSIVLQNGNYSAVGRDYVQIGLVQDRGIAKNAANIRRGSFYIKISEIESYYKEVKDRGVKITSELQTKPSKMKEFAVTDPDLNVIVFGEYTGPQGPSQ